MFRNQNDCVCFLKADFFSGFGRSLSSHKCYFSEFQGSTIDFIDIGLANILIVFISKDVKGARSFDVVPFLSTQYLAFACLSVN
jgi:hypothetical protein